MAELEEQIYALAGHPFNLDSPKQLAQVLFKELGLPTVRRTRTGDSTDAEVLEELAPRHPLPAKVIEYRQQSKLKSTYVDALPVLVLPARAACIRRSNGMWRDRPPRFLIPICRTSRGRATGADSRRLCSDPSWQLRCGLFRSIARFGIVQDTALMHAFATDQTFTQVAGQVYGVSPEAVTKDMRQAAKAINSGLSMGKPRLVWLSLALPE
jgi:DNA polymerase-1